MHDVPHYFLYGKTTPDTTPDYLALTVLQESLPKHNWEIHPHRHDQLHQLLILEAGSVLTQIRDRHHEEQAGCILSIPAREVHGFNHQPSVKGYLFTITEAFLKGLFAESERQVFPFLLTEPLILEPTDTSDYQAIRYAVAQLVQEYQQPRMGQSAMIGTYLKLVFILLGRLAKPLIVPSLTNDKNYDSKVTSYERFLSLLEQHYIKHWSVGQYAGLLGLTENRLNRLCQRYTGQNALQIVHGRLITEAKRKLIYTGLSISEVAYDLGFKDPAYFSRFFTKQCGEAPGAFKKRLNVQSS